MNILPSLTDAKKLRSRRYKVLPVSCEILSDICTPIEAVRILKNVSTHCYLLESAHQDEKWGRYTFLGFDPKLAITCENGKMRWEISPLRQRIPPPACVRSWRITKVPILTISPLHRRAGRVFFLRLPWIQRACGAHLRRGHGRL